MSRVVITVGAQADRSLVDVVRPYTEAWKRARAQGNAEARAATAAVRDAARAQSAMQRAEFNAQAALHRQHVRAKLQAERDAAREVAALHRRTAQEAQRASREEAKAREHVYQIKQRYLAQQDKEATGYRRTKFQTAADIGAGAMRNLGGIARAGVGVGRDVLRGAGVNLDLSALVGSSVAMQQQAVELSNAAFRDKPGEQRLDPRAIVRQARDIGGQYALDPSKVIGGLGQFQEKTGDLNTGMAGLKEWSAFAKATATDLDVLIASAGEVSIALGDAFESPQAKAKAITDVLKTLGAQGQEGAIEFRNLATQMPKLSAAAVSFEGDRAENLKKMGALVQLAKQQGGAPSAYSAATSIAGFANILKTPARVKEFQAAGVDVFSKKPGEAGKIRDPFEILHESLAKRGMDPLGFKKLFANVVGAKPAEALATTYRDAGGGAAGKKAVDALLAKFMGSMSDAKLKGDLDAAMGTDASKIQRLNNVLAAMGEELAGKLLPKLIEAAPAAMRFVEAMVGAAAWAAENPGKAITLAIVGSIAKASVGTAVSAGIQSAIQGGLTGATSLGALSGAGKAGAALGAISVAVATFTITSAVIEIVSSKVDRGTSESVGLEAQAGNARATAAMALQRGGATSAEMEDLQREKQNLEGRMSDATVLGRAALISQALNPFSDTSFADVGRAFNDAGTGSAAYMVDAAGNRTDEASGGMGALKQDLAALTAAIDALARKELKATVTVNQGATPGVDPAGRK